MDMGPFTRLEGVSNLEQDRYKKYEREIKVSKHGGPLTKLSMADERPRLIGELKNNCV